MRLYKCGVILLNQTCRRSSNTSTTTTPSRSSPGQEVSAELVIELYLISILCVIGLLGNLVSFAVLHYDKERREAMMLLQALFLVDSAYLLVAILRYPLKHLVSDSGTYTQMQPYVYPLLKVCQTLAIWMMVLVTVDRYVFVCHPLRAVQVLSTRTRRVLALAVVVFGFVFNLPRFFDSCVVTYFNACNNRSVSVMTYTGVFNKNLYFEIYLYALYIAVLYIAPLAILAYMNTRLIQAIRYSRSRHRGLGQTSHESGGGGDNNATLVLVIIVLLFVVCETPELILKIFNVIDRHLVNTSIFSKGTILFNKVSELLMVTNSSLNFFVYFTYGKRFRMVFKEKFVYRFQTNTTSLTNESLPLQTHA